jgi:hypothetical protein
LRLDWSNQALSPTGGNMTPCPMLLQCEICGSEIITDDFFHAPDAEETAPPLSRSPRCCLLGHRTAAFEVTAPRPNLGYPIATPPLLMDAATEFAEPLPRRQWLQRTASDPPPTLIATDDAHPTSKSIVPPPRLQPKCPDPASNGVRHHLRAPHGDPESRCSCNCLHLPVRGSTSPPAPTDRDPTGHLVRDDNPSITMLVTSGCNIHMLLVATSF